MKKKKLLHFLLYDYQGYTAKTDFFEMLYAIFAGLREGKSSLSTSSIQS